MDRLNIIEWEELEDPDVVSTLRAGESKNSILRLPYPADISDLALTLADLDLTWAGILPPYRQNDVTFTARCAASARDRLSLFGPVMVAVAVESRIDLEKFIASIYEGGFRSIAVPFRYGNRGQYSFGSLLQFMHGGLGHGAWFHIAGGKPEIPEASVDAVWTWSEEVL
jgi:hypothetical protein